MSYRFEPAQRFIWDRVGYVVTHVEKNIIRIEIVANSERMGERKNVDLKELNDAWSKGELRFEVSEREADPESDDPIVVAYKYPAWEDVPEALQNLAKFRLKVLKLFWAIENRTRKDVENLAAREDLQAEAKANGYALSVSSIYRWDEWYRDSGRDIRSLITDKEARQGGTWFDEEVWKTFKEVVEDKYLVPEKAFMKAVHEEMEKRITTKNKKRKPDDQLDLPGYLTVTRRIKKLDYQTVLIAKYGKDAAMKMLEQYGKMNYPDQPLVREEVDFTPIDLMILGKNGLPYGRADVISSICTGTAYPHGYSISFGRGYQAVMEWLRHAIMPKHTREQYGTENEWLAYGIFREIAPDNALEFGLAFEDACLVFGSAILPAFYRTPTQKPAIERYIRTVHHGIIHTLPGTTFSNFLEKGDYNPVEQACIFEDQIDPVVNLYFVDEYAQTKHRRLGMTPAQCWEKKTSKGIYPNMPGSIEELEIILRPSDYRVLHHYGLDFNYLRYNEKGNVELGILRKRMEEKKNQRRDKKRDGTKEDSGEVKFKFSPNDLAHIYIFDPFEGAKGRYIKVPSLDPEYTKGLTLSQHNVIQEYAKVELKKNEGDERITREILWETREKIRSEVLEGLDRKNQLKTNKRLARLVTGGKPTRNQEPSALTQPRPQQSEEENIPQPPPQQEGSEPLFTRKQRPQKSESDEPQDPAS